MLKLSNFSAIHYIESIRRRRRVSSNWLTSPYSTSVKRRSRFGADDNKIVKKSYLKCKLIRKNIFKKLCKCQKTRILKHFGEKASEKCSKSNLKKCRRVINNFYFYHLCQSISRNISSVVNGCGFF